MTTQSVLVLVGIVSVFATFGIVLVWADFYTQRRPKPLDEESPVVKTSHENSFDNRRAA
jgi:hypothetical protein